MTSLRNGINESRLRGDYHEYVTIEKIGESGVHVENYGEILGRSKMLPDRIRKSIEVAGDQCASKIISRIRKDYPGHDILSARAVGKVISKKKNDDVTDIELKIRKGKYDKVLGVSIKFTESATGSLTKNPGIGTIMRDYFMSPDGQKELDDFTEVARAEFLKKIVEDSGIRPERCDLKYIMSLSQKMPERYQIFRTNPFARGIRLDLTSSLRDKIYDLLQEIRKEKIIYGCRLILGIDSKTDYLIVSRNLRSGVKSEFEEIPNLSGKLNIIKNGKNSVFFVFDNVAFKLECGLRVKHMGSRVWDSIKLCGSREIRLASGKKV